MRDASKQEVAARAVVGWEALGEAEPGPPKYTFSTQCQLYLRDGESFRIWMNPILYLRQAERADGSPYGGEAERRRLLVHLLQERLRKLLYIHLHGYSLPELTRILWALGDRSRDRVAGELRTLDFLTTELRDFPDVDLTGTRRALSDLLKGARPTPTALAHGLAACYRDLEAEIERSEAGGFEHRVGPIRPFEEAEYLAQDAEYLKPVADLARHLRNAGRGLLRGAYLHGSLAAGGYVKGWSDVKVLLLLERGAVTSGEALLRARTLVTAAMNHVYQMDPYQHHGLFVTSEVDLDAYPQSLFPLAHFPSCLDLTARAAELTLRERDSGLERRRAVWDLCYLTRRHFLERNRPRNFYAWKTRLGTTLLIPRAYMEAQGVYGTGSEAMARTAAEVPAGTWSAVTHASAIRREWSGIPRLGQVARRLLPVRVGRGFWPWFAGHSGGVPARAQGAADEELRRQFELAEWVLDKLRNDAILS